MMSLTRKERSLSAYWDKDEGSTLPDDISGITVTAYGSGSSEGYVILRYYSPKADIVEAAKKSAQDSVF
jgi:hypothetical protein